MGRKGNLIHVMWDHSRTLGNLTPKLVNVHDVFHVSMLRRYVIDPTHVLERPPIELENNLQCEERLMRIMDTVGQSMVEEQIKRRSNLEK